MPHSVLEAMNYELTDYCIKFWWEFELLGDNDFGYLVDSLDIETCKYNLYKLLNDVLKKNLSKVKKLSE